MEKGTLLYIYKHFVGPNKSSTWFEQCNMQGIPSCWNSLCNYFRSSATIGHVGYFWYCRNGINIVPITPGILYSYTNLNKSWRTHSVIERSLPTFSENPRVEVLEVGRNWSLFIANEVNDPPKNMSRILRISSTTWNMTHLCSTPHGAFYVWTRMARVQRWMTSYISCISLSALPPPPTQKRISCKSLKCSSMLERVLEHVLLGSPGYTKKTPTIFFPHPTHDFWWSLSVLQLTLGFLLPVKLWAAWQVHWLIWFPFHRFMGFRTSQKGT